MKMNALSLQNRSDWEQRNVKLPEFDWQNMQEVTRKNPTWVHFGAGNIFRGFIAKLQQDLLEQGEVESGIVAADTFDFDIIDKIYTPYDSMTMLVSLMPDGSMKKEIVASVAKGIRANKDYPQDMWELKKAFRNPSLQMVSFTITEKGYALKDIHGNFFPVVEEDFENGPDFCNHAMSIVTAMLNDRFLCCGAPIAVVSMDNCSHNGEKLRESILTIAKKWRENRFVSEGFLYWLSDEANVSFPWSMIDKITPRPAAVVEEALNQAGIEDMAPVVTSKGTFIAPFVNAEQPQYLVVEDRFPNGRPPLEKAGVYMTDRETVNKTETMKVTTCLNPLHTALAVYGCMLGYTSIAAEMKDKELKKLVEGIGYTEGLPVVVDPQIISPREFINEVVEQRLPNPFIPDMPQRIATDTSQKVPIRFGETIKSYMAHPELNAGDLKYIPLALAGWLRYLLAVDDRGEAFQCSSDPMLETLQNQLSSVKLGSPETAAEEVLKPVLSNPTLFGVDLYEAGLAEKVTEYLKKMLTGPGAVRATLEEIV